MRLSSMSRRERAKQIADRIFAEQCERLGPIAYLEPDESITYRPDGSATVVRKVSNARELMNAFRL